MSGSSSSARSGGCLPSSTCGPTLPMSVGLSSQSFSGFRVDPEPVSVSAASVKVAGVNRPVRNHTFSPFACLIFLFSTIPTLLAQRFFSNHGMGGRRMLFLPMRCFLRLCKKLRSSSGEPQSPWFPELLDLVVDDSVALPLDRDLLKQPQVQ